MEVGEREARGEGGGGEEKESSVPMRAQEC